MSTDPTGLRPSPEPAGRPAPDSARAPSGSDAAPAATSDDARRRPARPATKERTGAPGAGRRAARRNGKVRKVHRVVRHFDVWSVAKVAAVFAACAYVVGMISGYLLWQAADRVGTIDGIEGFFEDAGGYDTFEILGDVVFTSVAVAGLLLAGLGIFVAVLAAVLFNLISDLTGGIRMTVIDEDLIVAPARRRPAGTAPAGPAPPSRADDPTAEYKADR